MALFNEFSGKFFALFHSNTEYLPYLQGGLTFLSLCGLLYYGINDPIMLLGLILSVFVYFLTGCLGVTMTFHRYYSHASFEFIRKHLAEIFSVFGSMGGTGSLIGWKTLHRPHHRYADTPRDPHSPVVHGWKILFGAYQGKFNKWSIRDAGLDVVSNPLHKFIHQYYYALLFIWSSIVLRVGDWWGLMFGFIIPVAIQIWMSNLSNYMNHVGIGDRPYKTGGRDNSHNVWWLSLLTWGEGGGHNFHHKNPRSYSFVDVNLPIWKRLLMDPTGVMIELVKK